MGGNQKKLLAEGVLHFGDASMICKKWTRATEPIFSLLSESVMQGDEEAMSIRPLMYEEPCMWQRSRTKSLSDVRWYKEQHNPGGP